MLVILYMSYNFSIIFPNLVSLPSQKIYLGFMDDIDNHVAKHKVEESLEKLQAEGIWGLE